MVDALGWRMKFGVVAPSTNTAVQPEFDAMRLRGVTNHFSRIHIPNDPLRGDDDFTKLIDTVSGKASAVASFQPPPLPQLTPARSLLLTAETGKAALMVLDAVATPPLLASAPSCASSGDALVPVKSEPTQPELPSVSPIRLLPWEPQADAPYTSGVPTLSVLPATMVLPSVTLVAAAF